MNQAINPIIFIIGLRAQVHRELSLRKIRMIGPVRHWAQESQPANENYDYRTGRGLMKIPGLSNKNKAGLLM
jgi:hypothetical protein